MLVKMLKPWATADFNYAVGTVVEVDTDTARELVDRGDAEAHEGFPAINPNVPAPAKRGRKPAPIVVQDSTPDAVPAARPPDPSPAPPVSLVEAPRAVNPAKDK